MSVHREKISKDKQGFNGRFGWMISAVKMVREPMTKRLLRSIFCYTTFCLNKLTTYELPYMVTPSCL